MKSRFRPCFATVALLLSLSACSRPPVGLYETASFEAVEYVRRSGKPLEMDIFVPLDGRQSRPAVVLWHGGGWGYGDRSLERDLARFLASMGYVTATASYRLWTDGATYPAAVQDALASVKFLRSKCREYGIDPDRIAAGGESAGGHLALMVGLARDHAVFKDDSYPGVRSDIQAVIDIYGPTDLVSVCEGGGPVVHYLCEGFMGCKAPESPESWREASPISHVRPDAPPVLILHGDRDSVVVYAQAVALAEALEKAGTKSRLVKVTGGKHAWGLHFNSVENQRTLPVIVDFLARTFCRDMPTSDSSQPSKVMAQQPQRRAPAD